MVDGVGVQMWTKILWAERATNGGHVLGHPVIGIQFRAAPEMDVRVYPRRGGHSVEHSPREVSGGRKARLCAPTLDTHRSDLVGPLCRLH